MHATPTQPPAAPFEQVRHSDADGREFWLARDLADILDYTQWRNFEQAIKRAMRACRNSGQNVPDHFAEASKMIPLGKGAQRKVEDYELSRYACYVIIQNADPEQAVVALGQTYFVVQTRRQEVADAAVLAGLTEDQQRLYLRGQLAVSNNLLAGTARGSGVRTAQDFAVFYDAGYTGLYGRLRAQDIHGRKGLTDTQHILDHMNPSELAANLFRATQADEKLQRDGITAKDAAHRAHHDVGTVVRRTIAELGGVMPEDQPIPIESTRVIEAEERERMQREQSPQLPLFEE